MIKFCKEDLHPWPLKVWNVQWTAADRCTRQSHCPSERQRPSNPMQSPKCIRHYKLEFWKYFSHNFALFLFCLERTWPKSTRILPALTHRYGTNSRRWNRYWIENLLLKSVKDSYKCNRRFNFLDTLERCNDGNNFF